MQGRQKTSDLEGNDTRKKKQVIQKETGEGGQK